MELTDVVTRIEFTPETLSAYPALANTKTFIFVLPGSFAFGLVHRGDRLDLQGVPPQLETRVTDRRWDMTEFGVTLTLVLDVKPR